jgi:hypothetical protein
MPSRLAAAVLTSLVAACTSIGPGTVPHDRIDYASSIGNSWKVQTLLNIVKLRYTDMPIFLEVAQVIAGYQLQSALSGSFTLGNFTANLIDRLSASGGATAASTYTDRPTVIYKPITAGIPASVEFREILAILALAAACFLAGLIVRIGPGLRAKNAVEATLLEKLPGYTLLRGLAGRVTGQADEPGFAPALAEIEEALVPALIVEKLENGSYTVLVPSVPTPMAGAIYILPPERVHPVDVPFTVALKGFSKWGTGAGDLVRAMQAASPAQARVAGRLINPGPKFPHRVGARLGMDPIGDIRADGRWKEALT